MSIPSVSQCGDPSFVLLQSPHCVNLRSPVKMGDASMIDTVLKDGLTDAFHNIHMGITGTVHTILTYTILLC